MNLERDFHSLEETFPNLPRDTCISSSLFNDFVIFDAQDRFDGGLLLWLSYEDYTKGMFVCVQIPEGVKLSITSIEELDILLYKELWPGLRAQMIKRL